MKGLQTISRSIIALLTAVLLCAGAPGALAQAADDAPRPVDKTLETLQSLVELRAGLRKDMQRLSREAAQAQSDSERNALKRQMDELEKELASTDRNFQTIAAGVDLTPLERPEQKVFDLQKEVLALVKPALDEMKEMTARMRQKADLKERIRAQQERIFLLNQAIANIQGLTEASREGGLKKSLAATADTWEKQRSFMQSELQAAKLQLDKLLAAETSIATASQSYLKSFFQKRGRYILEALAVVLVIVLMARMTHSAMERYIPGFRRQQRSFKVRVAELSHRLVTVLLLILGPMAVFYVEQDWVLFSLGILLLLGLALGLRHALPRYWSLIHLFLNIGSVREGERITLEGLPWHVRQINFYCTLVNPDAGISQRVPIDELVDKKSRPCAPDEPWFPCRKGDWVILDDGVRGKVVAISHELVELVERGGSRQTYRTEDFLGHSPRNISTSFRLKETIGISYALQGASTTEIPGKLEAFVRQRIAEEGYEPALLNLRVEFAEAGNSSLNLVVIADFKGDIADLYNRVRRAIQRWCVDACTAHGWEIPFPQLTVHGIPDRS
jgi:hypothetical protein